MIEGGRSMRKCFVILAAVFMLCAVTPRAYAQNAQVTGQVKDSSGGVIPGATVSARNQANGLTRTEVTDGSGAFRLVALPPGTYTVSTELQGFSTETRPDIVLNIDQTATINFTLKPASVAETVTVTGESPVVDVTRSDVSTAMSTQQIQDLPVAARRWTDMAMLTPGTSQDAIRGQFYRGNVSIGAGVTNFYSTGNVVDGVNNTWAEQGEPRQNFPMDGIEEFKVSTSAYKAEYGLATGGVLNVVTKSGTNDLHFSGFLFFRNAGLTEKQFFQKSNPPYSRYQDGGSVGGPVVKDKIHYFFTYERTDENIYNTVNAPAWPQYAGTFQSQQYRWTYLARADAQISQAQSLFFRFAKEYEYRPELTVGGVVTPTNSFDFAVPRTSAVAGHTWVINTRALNDFRFQYAFSKYEVAPPNSHGSWDAGYFGPDRTDFCQTQFNYPSIQIGGCGNSQMGPEHRYEVKDDFSYQLPNFKGRHQMKTGFDFSYLPFDEDSINSPLGTWTFPLDTPYDVNNPASYPTQYTQSLPNYANLPTKYYGLYLQDDWEIASGLTVNIGVRYDRQLGSFNEDVNHLLSLIGDKLGPQFASFPVTVPFINTSTRGDRNNVGPRIGFAWDPSRDGKMNIHSAFGLYYDNVRTLVNAGELTWPQTQQIIISKPSFPDPLQGKSRTAFLSTAPPNITVMDNQAQNPDSRSFNVGVTRSMGQSIGLTADYTLVNRYHDRSNVDLNLPDPATRVKPYPQFGRVTDLASVMNTTYRALLVKLDKRMSHRWSGLVSYTLSAARDQPIGNDLGGSYGFIREDGYSLADRRNKFVVSGTLQLPWNMQVSAIMDLRSSVPFNPATSRDINNDGYTIDTPVGVGVRSGCRDMNLAAVNTYRATFGLPAVGSVACPGYQDTDIRFSKSVLLQGHKLELIAQLFNITNHANFGPPVSNPLSATFGQVNQISSYINAPSRQGELAIRFLF
jgi:outer membrane receptor protein involved in Fe transport